MPFINSIEPHQAARVSLANTCRFHFIYGLPLAVPGLSVIESLIADPVFPADLSDLHAGFLLLENLYDLFFCKRSSSLPSSSNVILIGGLQNYTGIVCGGKINVLNSQVGACVFPPFIEVTLSESHSGLTTPDSPEVSKKRQIREGRREGVHQRQIIISQRNNFWFFSLG